MRNGPRGLTLTDLLIVVAMASLLVAVTLPTIAATQNQAGSKRDANNILGIHEAFLQFAADGDGTLPTPGLIDTDPDGEQNCGHNHTAALYSSMIAQLYITTSIVIGPTEVNPIVVEDDDYDFTAYDPPNDSYWDPAFTARIDGAPGGSNESNTSYAHMAITGDRRDLKWRDTGDANDPVLGTRGVKNGVGPGAPDYDRSQTLLLHGDPNRWIGIVVFSDHHREYLDDDFFPTVFLRHGMLVPDNIFAADFRHPNGNYAAADAFVIISRPTTDCDNASPNWDRLLE